MASKMPSPPPPPPPPPHADDLPGGVPYEAIITVMGTLSEQHAGTANGEVISATGEMSVVQGRVNDDPDSGFFAFLAIENLNVPLVSSSLSSRDAPGVYRLCIPNKKFLLTLDPRTEPKIVEGFEQVLQWFTTFENNAMPAGTVEVGSSGGGIKGMIERAGVSGAAMITKAGEGLNASVKKRTEAALAAQGDTPSKDVKLGGAVTATTLSGARKVVGAGASVAAAVIDKVSTVAGNVVANSSVVAGARSAPEGSKRRQTHDMLVTGVVAAGRIWEAADDQGRLLLASTGDSVGRVTGAKYGSEAEHAARSAGGIALDGWRIFRFPTKLGVTTLVKGAMKGVGEKHSSTSTASSTGAGPVAQPPSVAATKPAPGC